MILYYPRDTVQYSTVVAQRRAWFPQIKAQLQYGAKYSQRNLTRTVPRHNGRIAMLMWHENQTVPKGGEPRCSIPLLPICHFPSWKLHPHPRSPCPSSCFPHHLVPSSVRVNFLLPDAPLRPCLPLDSDGRIFRSISGPKDP